MSKEVKAKIVFISSMGGHLSELEQLSPIFHKYDYRIITELHDSTRGIEKKYPHRVDFLRAANRGNPIKYIFVGLKNLFLSLKYFLSFKPDIVVTTGAHTCVPMCYIAKIFRKHVIYIETFANLSSKTLTGRIIYPIADIFVVQWESMLKMYPKAVCWGWIF